MKYVYIVGSEWDIGLNNRAFSSEEKAWDAIEAAWKDHGLDKDMDFDEVIEDGLLVVDEIEVD